MQPNRIGAVILNALFVVYFVFEGLIALVYKQLFVFGKYVGRGHDLESPGNVLIATALFIVASLGVVPHLMDKEKFVKLGEYFLAVALLLFTIGFFQ